MGRAAWDGKCLCFSVFFCFELCGSDIGTSVLSDQTYPVCYLQCSTVLVVTRGLNADKIFVGIWAQPLNHQTRVSLISFAYVCWKLLYKMKSCKPSLTFSVTLGVFLASFSYSVYLGLHESSWRWVRLRTVWKRTFHVYKVRMPIATLSVLSRDHICSTETVKRSHGCEDIF